MKKLWIATVFSTLIIMLSLSQPALADTGYNSYADELNALGLFKGTNDGYELDAAPNRVTGSVMLIRLLGKEGEVLSKTHRHPFTDVPQWADSYIGFMYEAGLTQGITADKFGAEDSLDVNSYMTFVLRSLGYDDARNDFSWSTALDKGQELALIDSAEAGTIRQSSFNRGNMVRISRMALTAKLKGASQTLQDKLYAEGAITRKLGETKTEVEPKLKYDEASGYYGYVNKSMEWVIAPQYIQASEFSEGLAHAALDGGKYRGYITPEGKPAFAQEFPDGTSFHNGRALAWMPETSGAELKGLSVIDKQGKVIHNLQVNYDSFEEQDGLIYLRHIANGISRYYVLTDDMVLVDKPFSSIPKRYGDIIRVNQESASYQPGLLHAESGKLVTSFVSDGQEYSFTGMEYAEGIFKAEFTMKNRSYYAFYNSNLEPLAQKAFIKAEAFSEGVALVGEKDDDRALDKEIEYGYLNKDGSWFFEPEFIKATSFKDGVAAVKESVFTSYGILSITGDYLVPPVLPDFVKGTSMTQEQYDYVQVEADRVLHSVLTPSMSDLEKVLAINTYVVNQTQYDGENYNSFVEEVPIDSYTAYGVFKYGIAVCEGYATATQLLLDKAGIENQYVAGSIDKGETKQGHAWNLVKIDGSYYHLDTTWNDGINIYNFLLVSDEHMKTWGKREWNAANYPVVTSGYYGDKAQPLNE
ncbi:MAG: hypothetical protein K0Q90_952 [Paenibacillaceae bacterium]|jgi:hypothetical protein|nr:hypothetical protein [Paenibacillaceae bacterium]